MTLLLSLDLMMEVLLLALVFVLLRTSTNLRRLLFRLLLRSWSATMLTLHMVIPVVGAREAVLLLAALTARLRAQVLDNLMLLPLMTKSNGAARHGRDAGRGQRTTVLLDVRFNHFATKIISITPSSGRRDAY